MGAYSEVFSNEQISQMMNEFRSQGSKPSTSSSEEVDIDTPPMPLTGPQLPMFIAADQVLNPPNVGPELMRNPNWLNRQSTPDYPETFALMPTYAAPGYSEGRAALSVPVGPGTFGVGLSGNMTNNKPAFSGADIQYSTGDQSYGLEYRQDPRGRAILGRFSTSF